MRQWGGAAAGCLSKGACLACLACSLWVMSLSRLSRQPLASHCSATRQQTQPWPKPCWPRGRRGPSSLSPTELSDPCQDDQSTRSGGRGASMNGATPLPVQPCLCQHLPGAAPVRPPLSLRVRRKMRGRRKMKGGARGPESLITPSGVQRVGNTPHPRVGCVACKLWSGATRAPHVHDPTLGVEDHCCRQARTYRIQQTHTCARGGVPPPTCMATYIKPRACGGAEMLACHTVTGKLPTHSLVVGCVAMGGARHCCLALPAISCMGGGGGAHRQHYSRWMSWPRIHASWPLITP